MKTWIYDLETLSSFTATFEDKDTDEIKTFVLSDSINQIKELIIFLKTQVRGLIGYNCLTFDAQVLEYIFKHPNCSAKDIMLFANQLILTDNIQLIPEYKLKIPHLDLFHALSLSTKSKRTSLKWCEFQMQLPNIEDLPDSDDVNEILAYNYNDVYATKQLYLRHLKEIELRKKITKDENINLLNSTEPNMSKKLFTKWLSKEMNISEKDFRNQKGTNRPLVKVKDILFPYIEFKTELLQILYKDFSHLQLKENDTFEREILFGNTKVTYGLGGIHGSINNKIVESDDKMIIKSLDVKSYYPNLAIKNKLHPAHIPGEIFCKFYENLYIERTKIPKSDPRNYIIKINLNSLYGLTNDKFSPFRDRQYTLTICINGQLLLSMLFERILLEIPNSSLIIINTDGGEVLIPIEYQDKYSQICKEWEELTKLELEFVDYKRLIVKDVNNYISLTTYNSTKCKGMFEFENIPLHKNSSFLIIPEAIYNYFINNISIEEYVRNERNIYKFCAGVKAKHSAEKGRNWYELHSILDGKLHIEKLSKTVRYFISTKGKYLIKKYEDNTFAHVEAPKKIGKGKIKKDWKVTYFNKFYNVTNFKDYNIDYSYYISKIREVITSIEDKEQLKLF